MPPVPAPPSPPWPAPPVPVDASDELVVVVALLVVALALVLVAELDVLVAVPLLLSGVAAQATMVERVNIDAAKLVRMPHFLSYIQRRQARGQAFV